MRQDDAKQSGGDHDLGHYHCRNLYRRNLRHSVGVVAGVMNSSLQRLIADRLWALNIVWVGWILPT